MIWLPPGIVPSLDHGNRKGSGKKKEPRESVLRSLGYMTIRRGHGGPEKPILWLSGQCCSQPSREGFKIRAASGRPPAMSSYREIVLLLEVLLRLPITILHRFSEK